MVVKAVAVLLDEENTAKGLTCSTKVCGGTRFGTVCSLCTKLGGLNTGVVCLCHIDLWRADGDLLEKLIFLQHALKRKEEQSDERNSG